MNACLVSGLERELDTLPERPPPPDTRGVRDQMLQGAAHPPQRVRALLRLRPLQQDLPGDGGHQQGARPLRH